MRKYRTCSECFEEVSVEYLCDTCGESLLAKYWHIPITIHFGYGNILEGEDYHFCSLECLVKFTIEELNKNQITERGEE